MFALEKFDRFIDFSRKYNVSSKTGFSRKSGLFFNFGLKASLAALTSCENELETTHLATCLDFAVDRVNFFTSWSLSAPEDEELLSELELEFELELEDELLEELLLDYIVQLELEKVWSKARGWFTLSVFWLPPFPLLLKAE
jgi:hypothetical protein